MKLLLTILLAFAVLTIPSIASPGGKAGPPDKVEIQKVDLQKIDCSIQAVYAFEATYILQVNPVINDVGDLRMDPLSETRKISQVNPVVTDVGDLNRSCETFEISTIIEPDWPPLNTGIHERQNNYTGPPLI